MKKIRNILIMIIAVIALIGARFLSMPVLQKDSNDYSLQYEEEAVAVSNFGQSVLNNVESQDRTVKYFISGFIPLVMYLLSVLCLLDLIKSTYIKYEEEDSLIYKTMLLFLILLQMALIALISFYVADMSFNVLIIWLLVAVITVRIVYEGNYFVDILKLSDKIKKYK